MGMQNMQVQQPMQRSSGKGGGMMNNQMQQPSQQSALPKTVEDLYQQYAGRAGDAEGLAFWKAGFGDTIDANEVASFKNSIAEARAQGTEPANYGNTMQPRIGQPNRYSNTAPQWDNASIQPQQRPSSGGKGKG